MTERVLVVEDSKTYQRYLADQLSRLNIEMVLAQTLEQAHQVLAEDNDFLCALLDYCLPDGPNGEVIDLALSYHLRVIVITASFDEQRRQTVLDKGVLDYILKENMASVSYLLPFLNRLQRNKHHKALVVDDSAVVRSHLTALLEQQFIHTIEAEDGVQAIEILHAQPDITLVITDHHMPNKDGITMTVELRRQFDRTQLVILGLSSTDSGSITARFLKAGANDYLHKPFNQEEFYCRVNNLLDMKDSNDEMYRLANQDALTGLWNRRYLFQHADSSREQCNVAMLDVDYFKQVNDTYGHEGGDQALMMISSILRIYFPDHLVARVGGEEFCVIDYGDYNGFIQRLEHMRARVEKTPVPYDGKEIYLTISIGVTKTRRNIDTMISRADERLYQAKNAGRNRVIWQ